MTDLEKKELARKRTKLWKKNNKDKVKINAKNYYETHKEELREKARLQYKTSAKKEAYDNNKEKIKERANKWYNEHKDYALQQRKKYYENNKEKILESHRKYNKTEKGKQVQYKTRQRPEYKESHKLFCKASNKKYYVANKEKELKRIKLWKSDNKDKLNVMYKRHNNKRRGLGFKSLNTFFVGAQAHHLTKDYIVYIPKELHTSIAHNIWTNEGMLEINRKVIRYLINSGGVDEQS